MKWMMQNSDGARDGLFTMAVGSWIIASLAVLSSFLETVTVGDMLLRFRTADSALILGYIAATFSSYVIRRNAKLKADSATTELPGGE